MAHTDRDDERRERRDHWRGDCPNSYAYALREYGDHWRAWVFQPMRCAVCNNEKYVKNRYTGITGKNDWNHRQRRVERGRAKTAMRECRDWDSLVIGYHRPYWD